MNFISEIEFSGICKNIRAERESIIRYNPLGSDDEILLWMLLGVLAVFLSLSELETPCFNGKPNAETYRQAINHVLRDRRKSEFETGKYLDELIKQ